MFENMHCTKKLTCCKEWYKHAMTVTNHVLCRRNEMIRDSVIQDPNTWLLNLKDSVWCFDPPHFFCFERNDSDTPVRSNIAQNCLKDRGGFKSPSRRCDLLMVVGFVCEPFTPFLRRRRCEVSHPSDFGHLFSLGRGAWWAWLIDYSFIFIWV